ncbi:MAG: MCE family protein [Fibrobacter sp.]|jgi:ABC-type transporter Mla subunit MlaD|nr:MCE family protein [Fibrobacter sp.]
MKISDKAIGALSLIFLLFLLAFIAIKMFMAHQINTPEVFVDFTELGSIQPQDAVTIDGFNVGQIGSIQWLGNKARLSLKFNSPVVLREGTRILNSNYSLMGQRRIEIIRSKTGKVLPPKHVFEGEFQPGTAEALHLIENLKEQMETIRELTLLLMHGDSSSPSIIEVYNQKMLEIESLLVHLDKTSKMASQQIDVLLQSTENASQQILEAAFQADTLIQEISEQSEAKIQEAMQVLASVSKSTQKVDEYILKVQNHEEIQNLLTTTEKIEKINELLSKLNALSGAIHKDGLAMYDDNGKKIKLFPFKNMNIFGKTAREKARIRQKEELKKSP